MKANSHSLFDAPDYRAFLIAHLGPTGTRSGARGRLATAIGCHGSFLSLVLGGSQELNLEQAQRAAEFLELSEEEAEFFLTLVERARAGTPALRSRFDVRLRDLLERRRLIQNRVAKNRGISDGDRARFYSSWIYGAVHVLVSIPRFQTGASPIAAALGLPRATVDKALRFVEQIGLIERSSSGYRMREAHIHLERKDPTIRQHHANWRLRGLAKLDEERPEDLRYSLVFTASAEDVAWLRERTLTFIEEATLRIGPSAAEECRVLNLDFFGLSGGGR